MGYTIYADALFAINLAMDCYIFLMLKLALIYGARLGRVLAGAVLAAAISTVFVCAMAALGLYIPAVITIALSPLPLTAGAAAAFCPIAPKRFAQAVGMAYGLAALTAGAAGGLTGGRGGFPFIGLGCATVSVYITVKYVTTAIRRMKMTKTAHALVRVTLFGKTAKITALIDTGCALCDPFTGSPVIVCCARAIAKLISPGLAEIYNDIETADPAALIAAIEESGLASRVRVIPYVAVGADSALYGFTPDGVVITTEDGKRRKKKAIIAIAPKTFIGGAAALINPILID